MSDTKFIIRTTPTARETADLELICFPDPWDEHILARLLKNPHCGAWCLDTPSGVPVGILLYQTVANESEILRIGVDPSHRRQGWGRYLLCQFLNDCGENSVSRVVLEVRPSNTSARALYQALEFLQIGSRANYYTQPIEDSIILEKQIGSDQMSGAAENSVPGK